MYAFDKVIQTYIDVEAFRLNGTQEEMMTTKIGRNEKELTMAMKNTETPTGAASELMDGLCIGGTEQ